METALIRQKLEASTEDGGSLYEQLSSLTGNVFGTRYRLTELFDVGGQGVLYRAEDLEYPTTSLLLKMPLREYHRSAYLTAQKINDSRFGILWEAYILNQFAGTIFPEFYDLFLQVSPLHDPWWNTAVEPEDPFLVLEFVHGQTLDDVIGFLHKAQPKNFRVLERIARQVCNEVFSLLEMLWSAKPGFLYTDLRPQNIMLADATDQRGKPGWRRRHHETEEPLPPCRTDTAVRLIDAGSVVPTIPWKSKDLTWPCHLAYVPPEYYVSYEKSEQLPWPDVHFVLYTLGKTLWQFLAAKEPVPGQTPVFQEEIWRYYSEDLVWGIKALLDSGSASFAQVRRDNPILAERAPLESQDRQGR
jgi:serine/threonine protein kinase